MNTRPSSDLEALRHDLRQVYDGNPWHGSSINSVLTGVDAETAAVRSIPRAHTIWEIVLHMAGWTREVSSRLRGNPPQSPSEDWPRQRAEDGERGWRAALEELARAQKEIEQLVDELEPGDLVRWIGDQRDPSLGSGVTVGTLIRGLLEHHTYHEGQIAILKRAAESARGQDSSRANSSTGHGV